MKTVLILEDNAERTAAFRAAVRALGDGGFELKVWTEANSMMAECEAYFPTAVLISLDHHLGAGTKGAAAPGNGLDVARFLGDFLAACPVLIHTSDTERAYAMEHELRFTGWMVNRVGPLGLDAIQTTWLERARELMAEFPNRWKADLPPDHKERMALVRLSLDGLGLGDALGEMLSYHCELAPRWLASEASQLPPRPWRHTDDTEMAISIAAVLQSHGHVEQDALAKRFARRFERDPERGYGRMTRIQMQQIIAGGRWRETAANAFSGQGSMGNGGAMRVAPLGAYFADDLERCADQARASALVTHTHPEGVAGAMAVAVAAAMAWQLRTSTEPERPARLFEAVLRHTPESKVRNGITLASATPPGTPVGQAARALGNGSLVTAPDTVPFCLWMAAHHLGQFKDALGNTIGAGGDCDTNAAIVAGIVALSAGRAAIPNEWLLARELVHP